MARARHDGGADAEAAPRQSWARIRVTAYKVRTSQGRFLGGDIATLPATEAETLVTEGKAKPA